MDQDVRQIYPDEDSRLTPLNSPLSHSTNVSWQRQSEENEMLENEKLRGDNKKLRGGNYTLRSRVECLKYGIRRLQDAKSQIPKKIDEAKEEMTLDEFLSTRDVSSGKGLNQTAIAYA